MIIKGVTFHQDNARPHVSRQKLFELNSKCNNLIHHALKNFKSVDFFLSQSLQNSPNGQKFTLWSRLKIFSENFFYENPDSLWRDEIFKSHEKWRMLLRRMAHI